MIESSHRAQCQRLFQKGSSARIVTYIENFITGESSFIAAGSFRTGTNTRAPFYGLYRTPCPQCF